MISRVPSLRLFFRILILLVGAAQCWRFRDVVSSMDMIAYLDMATALTRGQFWDFVNGYWSPAYPTLVAIAKFLMGAGVTEDYAAARLANLFVLVLALRNLESLLEGLLRDATPSRLPAELLWGATYLGFLWMILKWIPVHFVGADLLLAATFFGVVASLVRLRRGEPGYGALGLWLGVGYLTKAVFFPLTLLLAVAFAFFHRSLRPSGRGLLRAGLLFACLALPWAGLVSKKLGRPTFGDTGRLNYIWFMTDCEPFVPYSTLREWGCLDTRYPIGEILSEDPWVRAYRGINEWASDTNWYDPALWGQGFRVVFSLDRLLRIVMTNLTFYLRHFGLALLGAFLLLQFLLDRRSLRRAGRCLAYDGLVGLAILGGLALYGIGIELPRAFFPMRYIAPFVIAAGLVLLASLRVTGSFWPRYRNFVLLGAIALSIPFFRPVRAAFRQVFLPPIPRMDLTLAQAFREAGLEPGARLALVTSSKDDIDVSAARLADMRMMAFIRGAAEFTRVPLPKRLEVFESLRRVGVEGILAPAGPHESSWMSPLTTPIDFDPPAGLPYRLHWRRLGETGYVLGIFAP